MKHGRRHSKLKEQAYLARKDAEGYGTPYRAIDVAEPTRVRDAAEEDEPQDAGVPVGKLLTTKQRKQLAWRGVAADDDADAERDDA